MFTHETAIVTLIASDPSATDAEKAAAIAAVAGKPSKTDCEVVSFRRAAEILGYKSTKGVRKALHNGVLRGFYGGLKRKRCTGILMSSIKAAILGG